MAWLNIRGSIQSVVDGSCRPRLDLSPKHRVPIFAKSIVNHFVVRKVISLSCPFFWFSCTKMKTYFDLRRSRRIVRWFASCSTFFPCIRWLWFLLWFLCSVTGVVLLFFIHFLTVLH